MHGTHKLPPLFPLFPLVGDLKDFSYSVYE
jgi:hypothetical protein